MAMHSPRLAKAPNTTWSCGQVRVGGEGATAATERRLGRCVRSSWLSKVQVFIECVDTDMGCQARPTSTSSASPQGKAVKRQVATQAQPSAMQAGVSTKKGKAGGAQE